METNPIVEAVNRLLLKPLGFERRGSLFNRHRGEFVDVVDLPLNKAGDAVTLEVGIQHDGLYETLWEAPPPRFSNEAACVVHSRIGALAGGDDIWWPLADPESPARAVKAVEGPVLRFLQGHHDLPSIANELAKSIGQQRAPLPMLYLAILRSRRGDNSGAAELLGDVAREWPDAWGQPAAGILARLVRRKRVPVPPT